MQYKKETVKSGYVVSEHYIPVNVNKDKPLIFFHSSGHGSWMWKNFLHYFANVGYDTWALNLRGHYLSGQVEDWADVGADEYLEDIDKAVNRAEGNSFLVGHSMSGILVLKYAELNKPAGLIVSQSGPPKNIREKHGLNFKRPVPKEVEGQKFHPGLKDREKIKSLLFDRNNVDDESIELVMENIGEESSRATREIMEIIIDPDKVTSPLYVLGYDMTKIGMKIDVEINRIIADEFGARDYKIIEPGGHNYMLERNWEVFARQFELWIDKS